jgi:tetratricopeptide (TPR) repeat protein
MRIFGILCVFLFWGLQVVAQPNCTLLKDDKDCYEACQDAMTAIRYRQGSWQSQQYFDQSIERCPDFAYSYMEKAVPFLKRGLFVEWKQLIDKAVALEPESYLGYRGWCRLQFLRDYEGAIADIKALKALVPYDIGFCQTGDYHLNIALGLCYKKTGEIEKARALFESQTAVEGVPVGLYDYYHWGVMEYEQGNYQLAIEKLEQQVAVNGDLAETYYFLALAHKALEQNQAYGDYLKKAEDYYRKGNIRTDTYTEMLDKIYLSDILNAKR